MRTRIVPSNSSLPSSLRSCRPGTQDAAFGKSSRNWRTLWGGASTVTLCSNLTGRSLEEDALEGASGEDDGHVALVIGAAAEVVQRVDLVGDGVGGAADVV